jgi:hypothetical protein
MSILEYLADKQEKHFISRRTTPDKPCSIVAEKKEDDKMTNYPTHTYEEALAIAEKLNADIPWESVKNMSGMFKEFKFCYFPKYEDNDRYVVCQDGQVVTRCKITNRDCFDSCMTCIIGMAGLMDMYNEYKREKNVAIQEEH